MVIIDVFKELCYVDENSYIFPILSEFHQMPQQITDRTKKINRQTNQDLKEIATLANVTTELTTYVALHSFATIQKRSGMTSILFSANQSLRYQI